MNETEKEARASVRGNHRAPENEATQGNEGNVYREVARRLTLALEEAEAKAPSMGPPSPTLVDDVLQVASEVYSLTRPDEAKEAVDKLRESLERSVTRIEEAVAGPTSSERALKAVEEKHETPPETPEDFAELLLRVLESVRLHWKWMVSCRRFPESYLVTTDQRELRGSRHEPTPHGIVLHDLAAEVRKALSKSPPPRASPHSQAHDGTWRNESLTWSGSSDMETGPSIDVTSEDPDYFRRARLSALGDRIEELLGSIEEWRGELRRRVADQDRALRAAACRTMGDLTAPEWHPVLAHVLRKPQTFGELLWPYPKEERTRVMRSLLRDDELIPELVKHSHSWWSVAAIAKDPDSGLDLGPSGPLVQVCDYFCRGTGEDEVVALSNRDFVYRLLDAAERDPIRLVEIERKFSGVKELARVAGAWRDLEASGSEEDQELAARFHRIFERIPGLLAREHPERLVFLASDIMLWTGLAREEEALATREEEEKRGDWSRGPQGQVTGLVRRHLTHPGEAEALRGTGEFLSGFVEPSHVLEATRALGEAPVLDEDEKGRAGPDRDEAVERLAHAVRRALGMVGNPETMSQENRGHPGLEASTKADSTEAEEGEEHVGFLLDPDAWPGELWEAVARVLVTGLRRTLHLKEGGQERERQLRNLMEALEGCLEAEPEMVLDEQGLDELIGGLAPYPDLWQTVYERIVPRIGGHESGEAGAPPKPRMNPGP